MIQILLHQFDLLSVKHCLDDDGPSNFTLWFLMKLYTPAKSAISEASFLSQYNMRASSAVAHQEFVSTYPGV